MQILLIFVLVIGGLGVFVGFWMAGSWLLALLSGWRALARRYRVAGEANLAMQNTSGMFVMAWLGMVSYENVLHVGASPGGLELRVMGLFRAGHPPLRIPWVEVRVQDERAGLFRSQTLLELGSHGAILRLPSKVWQGLNRPR